MGVGALSRSGAPLSFRAEERIGVLGGTFDPIHRAHLHLADAAAAALQLDRLILIPAGDPWRKRGRVVSPAAARYEMVEAAVRERGGGLEVSDLELRRVGPTYTLDTVAELRAAGAVQLWWIMAADALADLPNWHRPAEIISRARLAVAARPGTELAAHRLDGLIPGLARWLDWVPMEPIDLSSTAIRERIAAGGDVRGDVPAAAFEVICRRGLYGAR